MSNYNKENPRGAKTSDKSGVRFKVLIIVVWALFNASLSGWWIYFSFVQLERFQTIAPEHGDKLLRKQRMLLWEGITLVGMLFLGAGALSYYVVREARQRGELLRFFSTFSHELKTPIASLRLQAEAIQNKVHDEGVQTLIQRLVSQTNRLTLQLENSLFLSTINSGSVLLEPILISQAVQSLREEFPTLTVELNTDARVLADTRAFSAVLHNLAQNAIVHGRATGLSLTLRETGPNVRLLVKDNGTGFHGEARELGSLFHRHTATSGSGIGIYLIRQLMEQMKGSFEITNPDDGFACELTLEAVRL